MRWCVGSGVWVGYGRVGGVGGVGRVGGVGGVGRVGGVGGYVDWWLWMLA